MKVLAYISSRGRYDTTLANAMLSVALQSRPVDKFVLFDDNDPDKRKDLRSISLYQHIFKLFDEKGIAWEVAYGEGKGQTLNHQKANKMGYDLCFRIDDDEFAESNVLEILLSNMTDDVGAVGGLVIVPNMAMEPAPEGTNNSIDTFFSHPNLQWFRQEGKKEVEHLYSSFLYRAGIVDYNMSLSPVGHTEETQFSYSLHRKGYKLIVDPSAITYHFREAAGGIRDGQSQANWQHDDDLFKYWLEFQKSGKKLYVFNQGLGDDYMARQALTFPENALIACCHPEVFPEYETISIAYAKKLVDIEKYNIYKWCGDNGWQGHLIDAFKTMYENLV